MTTAWKPANQVPQPHSGYWGQLAQLARISTRTPHPGLPVVTQRLLPQGGGSPHAR